MSERLATREMDRISLLTFVTRWGYPLTFRRPSVIFDAM